MAAATAPPASGPPSNSSRRVVLYQFQLLREDIGQVRVRGWPGTLLLGWWVEPLKMISQVGLRWTESLAMPLLSWVPQIQPVISVALQGTSMLVASSQWIGTTVRLLEPPLDPNEKSLVDHQGIVHDDSLSQQEFRRFLGGGISMFYTAVGFGTGVFLDLVSLFFHKGKLSKWVQTVQDLDAYLTRSGIDREMDSLLFQFDFVLNLMALAQAQSLLRNVESDVVPTRVQLDTGRTLMKYATAVYGIASIKAVRVQGMDVNQMIDVVLDDDPSESVHSAPHLSRLAADNPAYLVEDPHEIAALLAISQHTEIPEDQITLYTRPSGTCDVLRHFVAVDVAQRRVVLAIRGTFSLSEIVTDIDGAACPFGGGLAHRGIAQQAELLWETVGSIVQAALDAHPGFNFVITGHSLGAGAACLLTIKCYHEQLLKGSNPTKVQCFAFAPPPVFSPLSAAPLAVANTTCFIHDDDCVPFLSVANVREFMDSIKVVRTFPLTSKLDMIFGEHDNNELCRSLLHSVSQSSTSSLVTVEGAPKFAIPATDVVWMRGDADTSYMAYIFEPERLPEIHVDVDMISDHFPPCYEEALRILCEGDEEDLPANTLGQ
eukprot:Nitzschia sp. Nitz4//scaffold450_size6464//2825//4704//NITZ4_009175-RA/size6464-augustus-gene-0.3-mRNA-1//1//CDS//3329552257//8887//frame0